MVIELEVSENLQPIVEIVKKTVPKYTTIESQIKESVRLVKKLPNYEQLVDHLIFRAVQRLVYLRRSTRNHTEKYDRGEYRTIQKVNIMKSEKIKEISQSLCDKLYFGSYLLGDMTKGELIRISNNEEGIAAGHLRNVKFLKQVAQIVPEGKTVREAVKEQKLQKLFDQCYGKKKQAA